MHSFLLSRLRIALNHMFRKLPTCLHSLIHDLLIWRYRMKKAIICLFLFIIFLPTIADCAEVVTIAIEEPTLKDYNRLVARHGNNPQRIERILADGAGRPVVDLVILAKALYLGGMDAHLEFDIVPNVRRETEHVVTGVSVLCGQQLNKGTIYVSGYSDSLYMSAPHHPLR